MTDRPDPVAERKLEEMREYLRGTDALPDGREERRPRSRTLVGGGQFREARVPPVEDPDTFAPASQQRYEEWKKRIPLPPALGEGTCKGSTRASRKAARKRQRAARRRSR